jgi:uncharacterized protein YbjT (DUF2867 family)
VVGDLGRPETLPAAFDGAEQVFVMGTGHGLEHTANAVAAATKAGVQRIVNLSSIGVALEPMPIMGRWHQEREEVIEATGVGCTFLRPSNFMTNTLWWAAAIRAEGVVRDPVGPGRLSLIDPADIAAVAAAALTQDGHTGQAYVLTGGELLTVKQQTQILSDVLGRPIQYLEQTPEQAADVLLAQGAAAELVAATRDLNELFRADRAAIVTDVVERLTGRPPATFQDWCRRNAAAFAS